MPSTGSARDDQTCPHHWATHRRVHHDISTIRHPSTTRERKLHYSHLQITMSLSPRPASTPSTASINCDGEGKGPNGDNSRERPSPDHSLLQPRAVCSYDGNGNSRVFSDSLSWTGEKPLRWNGPFHKSTIGHKLQSVLRLSGQHRPRRLYPYLCDTFQDAGV